GACFSVGLATIHAAIEAGAVANVEGIGEALRAGTNCGSCLPELKRIVAEAGGGAAAASSQATSNDRRGRPAPGTALGPGDSRRRLLPGDYRRYPGGCFGSGIPRSKLPLAHAVPSS